MSEIRDSQSLRRVFGSVPRGIAAALLVLLVASGCGDGDQSEPTAPAPADESAAQPSEEPATEPSDEPATEPAAQPSEEPAAEPADQPSEEPAAPLGVLAVTGETTVAELLVRLPGEDSDCVRDRFGDSEFETLTVTTLDRLIQDLTTAERFIACFELENSRGLALIEAQDGGLAPDTHLCLVTLSYDHPELLALRIGVPLDTLETDDLAIHQMFLDIYGCMTPLEQVVLTTRIAQGLDMAYPLTMRDIEFSFTEDEVSCMSQSVDDWEALLDSPPSPATLMTAMECFESDLMELQTRYFGAALLAALSDVRSEESLSCMVNSIGERQDFMEAGLPMAEFTENRDPAVFEANLDVYSKAVQDAILFLDCLSDDELRRFQQRIPPALQAFQSQPHSSE